MRVHLAMFVRCWLAFVAIAWALLSVSEPASAYCRKSTDSPTDESFDPAVAGNCGDQPDALPLYWSEGCVEYALVVDQDLIASGTMSQSRAEAIVQSGMEAWMQAECPVTKGSGVQPPAIKTVEVGQGRCPNATEATKNEVHFTSQAAPGEALALTDVTYDLGTGKMLLAVTRVFNVYGRLGQTPADVDKALGYVVKHEIGHFLGLAHSQHTDAVMYASYRARQNGALTDDDTAAICDAYNPESPIGAGCALAGAEPRDAWPILFALAWLPLRARRRRPPPPRWGPSRRARNGVPRRASGAAIASAALLTAFAPDAQAIEVSSRPAAEAPTHPRGVTVKPRRKPAPKPRRKPVAKPVRKATGWWGVRTIVRRREDPNAPVEPPPVEPPKPPPVAPPPPARPVPGPAGPSAPQVAARTDTTPGLRLGPSGAPGRDRPAGEGARPPTGAAIYAGARYRAFVLPQPVFNLVGRAGKTLFFQSVAIEGDYRKGALSIVPALSFADLSSGDMVVGSRSSDLTSSFSYVKSQLKALAASVALAWSFPMSDAVSFELGFELGVGFTFGTLIDNWVTEAPDGPLAYNGRHFKPCQTAFDGVGCSPQEHSSPTPQKIGNYAEPSMFSGGKAPTLIPWVSLPLVGVRAQLSDEIAARFGVGASFTGVWAGASFDYVVRR